VPHNFVDDGFRGHLEDRRPNSQGTPSLSPGRIIERIATVDARASA
jgi:glutamine synthetase